MRLCYSNNGFSVRHVSEDQTVGEEFVAGYVAEDGEVIFDHHATQEELDAAFPSRSVTRQSIAAARIRAERDKMLASIDWRYARHSSQTRLGLPTTDDIASLDAYAQALRDVPLQQGFPDSIVWPQLAE